jgi:hypothetical protein
VVRSKIVVHALRLSHRRALGLFLFSTACSVYDLSALGPGDAGAKGSAGKADASSGSGGSSVGATDGVGTGTNATTSAGGAAGDGTGGSAAGSNPTSGGASGGKAGGATSGGGAGATGGAPDGGTAGRGTGGGGSRATGGSGGASSSGGAAGAVGTAGRAGSGGAPILDLIDDLEDHNSTIRVVGVRDGVWDTSNDMTPGGVQTPPPSMFAPVALAGDTPYAGDTYAAYTKGSGFVTYGAFMNVSMRSWPDYATTPTYDASTYQGLSFWAKVGASSTTTVRVRFISADTDPRGGKCKTTGPTDQLCFNHYYLDVPVTTSWKLYTIRFADFVQPNNGAIFPTINLSQMYGLEFYFLTGANFEVWIDDLAFYKF